MTAALIYLIIKLIIKRLTNDEIRAELGIEKGSDLDKEFVKLARSLRRRRLRYDD